MKELEAPFRLYDFLAYLFPGAATLHGVYLLSQGNDVAPFESMLTGNAVVDFAIGVVAAYAVGVLWSVVSREVLRRAVWWLCNPRIDYLRPGRAARSPLGTVLSERLQVQISKQFGEANLSPEQAHRLCRVYVAQHCSNSWERRQSIVASRAMCANFVGPAALYCIAFALRGWCIVATVAGIGALVLAAKTVVLDQREWKEIYFAFLSHQASGHQPDSGSAKETKND